MAKEYAVKFYRSKAWIDCRDSYFKFKHGLCERCGNGGLIVHHKRYITPDNISDPEITLNWDNLELLCERCHQHEHFKSGEVVREGLEFDGNGNVVEVGKDS